LEGFLSLKKCNLIETFPSKGTFPFKWVATNHG
jgi:hypothetical protein